MALEKTVLVTGASGAIGRHVVPALIAAGYQVRAQYARQPAPGLAADWRQWNLLDGRPVDALVEGCDGVVHLAAEIAEPDRMVRLNVEATRDLAAAAERAGVRHFCHASSVVVYGSPLNAEVDETTLLIDPAKPVDQQYHAEPYMLEYARTKVLGELALRALAPRMSISLVRPTVVADLDKLVECAGWSLPRRVIAASRRTQYVYVADVAAAIVHLIATAPTGVEAFNICDEDSGTYADLFDRLGGRSWLTKLHAPAGLDLAKDMVKHRTAQVRYPLGQLRISNAKLKATGLPAPIGFARALDQAVARLELTKEVA